MENVPGFMTKYKGEIFENLLAYIKENLPEYEVKYSILEAKEYSVPQARKRLFVCGYRKEYNFDFPKENREFCNGKKYVTVSETLSDLPYIQDDWRLDKTPYSSEVVNPYQAIMRKGQSHVVTNNICRVSNPQAKELFEAPTPKRFVTALNARMTVAPSVTAAVSTGLFNIPTK